MRLVLERVDDDVPDAVDRGERFIRKIADVAAVSDRPHAEPERVDRTMLLPKRRQRQQSTGSVDLETLPGGNGDVPGDRRIVAARRCLETVAKCLEHAIVGRGVGIDRYSRLLCEHIAAQIVDAVNMIGMWMRQRDGVETRNGCTEHLLVKIRSAVDGDHGPTSDAYSFDESGAAGAPVPGVCRIAGAPVTIDPGHAR